MCSSEACCEPQQPGSTTLADQRQLAYLPAPCAASAVPLISGSWPVCHTGDGRLGLLIAQVLALKAPGRVTHIGRHISKVSLVTGTVQQVVSSGTTADTYQGQFDLVVEATGETGLT